MKRTNTPLPRAHGFSLIEVMVAVVVICIGLLGIAKMQAMALSNTNMSRQRSLAAIEAASFASAMHSNRQYWAAFATNFSVTIKGSPAVVTVVGDPALQAPTAADLVGPGPTVACIGNALKCHGSGLGNRVHRAFGIVLMRLRIPEQRQDFVRGNGGNRSAHSRDCGDGRVLEIPGDLDQVFRIELDGESHGAHDLAR